MKLPADRQTFDYIAESLEYPTSSTGLSAGLVAQRLEKSCPAAAEAFAQLATWLEATSQDEAEETYTAMFDLRPSCSLHVGYHVFGDAYQRGELLAGLVPELLKAGVPLGSEIPDFLPTVLRLLGRLPEDEYLEIFINEILSVALDKMRAELRPTRTPWARAVISLNDLFGERPATTKRDPKKVETLQDRIDREARHA